MSCRVCANSKSWRGRLSVPSFPLRPRNRVVRRGRAGGRSVTASLKRLAKRRMNQTPRPRIAESMQERLQKIIAAAGVTSRRKAEQLIVEGRVRVNGKVVEALGSKADPERDHIKVDGKLLRPLRGHVYLLLNKPPGYVSTLSDPENRATVVSLLPGVKERVYPVGRLDYHSSGLLLLTNDGDLANFLMSHSSRVPRTYQVKLDGHPPPADLARLEQGIVLDGRSTAPARIRP